METHCYAGYSVSPFYDPMLAKLIVRGSDRAEAVRKLQTALHEFEVSGIATNIPFLRRLVASPEYEAGTFDTGFVGRFLARS
jgi:acetyl-CoA carboxylase biotin carboxylase subunit